jgi:hypothetical protein
MSHEAWNTGVKPLTPAEANIAKASSIPDGVIAAVNELLAEQGNRSHIILYQDDVMDRVLAHMDSVTRQEVFKNKWLDFENLFQSVGWAVEYDSPAYNESYKAHWIFTK